MSKYRQCGMAGDSMEMLILNRRALLSFCSIDTEGRFFLKKEKIKSRQCLEELVNFASSCFWFWQVVSWIIITDSSLQYIHKDHEIALSPFLLSQFISRNWQILCTPKQQERFLLILEGAQRMTIELSSYMVLFDLKYQNDKIDMMCPSGKFITKY